MATKYKVYWDNGNHACGTIPQVFDTEAEAQAFADNWVNEMNVMTLAEVEGPEDEDDSGCTAEVIEVEEQEEDFANTPDICTCGLRIHSGVRVVIDGTPYHEDCAPDDEDEEGDDA